MGAGSPFATAAPEKATTMPAPAVAAIARIRRGSTWNRFPLRAWRAPRWPVISMNAATAATSPASSWSVGGPAALSSRLASACCEKGASGWAPRRASSRSASAAVSGSLPLRREEWCMAEGRPPPGGVQVERGLQQPPLQLAAFLPQTAPEPAEPATRRHPGHASRAQLLPRRPAEITTRCARDATKSHDSPRTSMFNPNRY
jgi:hypothetical protein